MRIVMMGSGGVGGFFGARLAKVGEDVSFVARGKHLEAIRKDGILIENQPQGDLRAEGVRASADPKDLGPADIVILSVKLWDTEEAARAVQPIVGPDTAVLSLQNGVIKDDILRRIFPEKNIMGGVAYVASHIARPGVIHQTGTMQRIVVGEYAGGTSERARKLHEALLRSGVAAELSTDVRRSIWEKYVFLVGLSATTATTRRPLGAVLENPRSKDFLLEVMREVVRVGRAKGVALPEDYADQRLAFASTLPHDMTSSMAVDLDRGNRLEVEWLSGGVVKLGKEAGVDTPANEAVWAILAPHAQGRAAN
jgi:2-dehydropantoate 2-reductase